MLAVSEVGDPGHGTPVGFVGVVGCGSLRDPGREPRGVDWVGGLWSPPERNGGSVRGRSLEVRSNMESHRPFVLGDVLCPNACRASVASVSRAECERPG